MIVVVMVIEMKMRGTWNDGVGSNDERMMVMGTMVMAATIR